MGKIQAPRQPSEWGQEEVREALGALGLGLLAVGEAPSLLSGFVEVCDKENVVAVRAANEKLIEDRAGPLALLLCEAIGVELEPVAQASPVLIPWRAYGRGGVLRLA